MRQLAKILTAALAAPADVAVQVGAASRIRLGGEQGQSAVAAAHQLVGVLAQRVQQDHGVLDAIHVEGIGLLNVGVQQRGEAGSHLLRRS